MGQKQTEAQAPLKIIPNKVISVCCYSQFLGLCGAAYRPTEEIDLRSIGWGNIFQLPFKHLRDYRLRLLCPFFIYSGFETLFAISGFTLVLNSCRLSVQ